MTTEVAFVSMIDGQISIISVHECTDEQRSKRLRSYAVDYVKKIGTYDDIVYDGKNIIDHLGLVLAWNGVNNIDVHNVTESKLAGWIRSNTVRSSKHIATFYTLLIPECLTSVKDELIVVKNELNVVKDELIVAKDELIVVKDELIVAKDEIAFDIKCDQSTVHALKNTLNILEEDSFRLRISLEEAELIIADENIEQLKYENQILTNTIDSDYETIITLRNDISELRQRIVDIQNEYTIDYNCVLPCNINTWNKIKPSTHKSPVIESAYDQLVKQIKCFDRQSLKNTQIDALMSLEL